MKKILCIDGGGLKGAMPAALLAEIEEATGRRVVDHFDLIAGTSTGGIIAIGIALGIPAQRILDFYCNEGPNVFNQANAHALTRIHRGYMRLRHLLGAKYSSASLKRALTSVLGNQRIGDSQTRLLIPAYNSVLRGVHVIKTAHHPRFERDWKLSCVDAALATAAAPTYFPEHVMENDVGLIDGGVWANNPSGLAAIEAIEILNWDKTEIKMLSLGCGDEALRPPKSVGMLGAAIDSERSILKLIMQGQSFGSSGTAQILLGDPHERHAYFRINPTVPIKFAALDDASRLHELIAIGRAQARSELPIIRKEFFGEQRDIFTPYHGQKEAA